MVEVLKAQCDEIEIRRRPRQRNMNLAVKSDGKIRVSCNLRRSKREILAFVDSCRDFIATRREKLAELDRLYPRLKFLTGDSIAFLGEPLKIEVIWIWDAKARAQRTASALELKTPLKSTVDQRRDAIVRIYKKEARRLFEARLKFFAGVMGVTPTSLSVRGQRTLWGSCTGAGAISLNWKLMACPPQVIDYVVIHELAHIPYRNHSRQFWDFVARFDPHYKDHRAQLKRQEPAIARMF